MGGRIAFMGVQARGCWCTEKKGAIKRILGAGLEDIVPLERRGAEDSSSSSVTKSTSNSQRTKNEAPKDSKRASS